MNRNQGDPMWRYVIYSYLAFFFIVLALGGAVFMLIGAESIAMTAVQVLGAWSPTIVLILMLKKIKPGMTVKSFYNQAFQDKINLIVLIEIALLVLGVFLASTWFVSFIEGTPLASQFRTPVPIAGTVILMAFRGPCGEESGWRGYLRPEMEARYGFFKGNLVLGLVWAFWHIPTWIVEMITGSGGGLEFVIYIAANLIVMTSLTLIMGVLMKRCNNLLMAFWIHYCFNLSLLFTVGSKYFFLTISVLYAVAAFVLLLFHQRKRARL